MGSDCLKQEKYTGCLLGGAIGDALGAPIEFLHLQSIREQFGYDGIKDFHPAYGKLGAITDDTQMTLFTAEGLLRGLVRFRERGIGGAEIILIHEAYLRWLETQKSPFNDDMSKNNGWLITVEALRSRRGPGNTCISSLSSEASLGKPLKNDRKGCGTVMRVAPIGLLHDVDLAYRIGKHSSALTHGHPTASIAAGALCVIIAQLRNETPLKQAVMAALDMVKQDEKEQRVINETSLSIEKALALAERPDEPSPELVETLGGGWVAEEALAISIYCALVARDFKHGVLLAVNHSGDSDSTGAITGNLLGVQYGLKGIPNYWVERVELHDEIQQIAIDLIEVPEKYYIDDDTGYSNEIFKKYPGA